MSKQPKSHPHDVIWLGERIVSAAEGENEDRVELPTMLARLLLEQAKRAPLLKGREPLTRAQRLLYSRATVKLRARKAELVEGGMRKEKAGEQAGEETVTWLREQHGVLVAPSTLKRRAEKRRKPTTPRR
jgi:hypothetical protein